MFFVMCADKRHMTAAFTGNSNKGFMHLDIQSVAKTFITSFTRKKIQAVQDFSLSIDPGEIFGIVGPNGAGKSTVLKMLMGFIRPDKGKISLLGKQPGDPESREHCGYLPENPYFYDHLSAFELLQFSARASDMPPHNINPRIDQLLKLTGLDSAKNRRLRSYSKGMIQRAGICFALVHDPNIVVLDEPMSGLDPLGQQMVVDIILDLKKRGKTVLFCSHILSDVERICDRTGIMVHGRLRKILQKNELLDQGNSVRIVADALTPELERRCREFGWSVLTKSTHVTITCPREHLSDALTLCGEEKVRIITVDNTVNTLEQIFLQTVKETEP